MYISVWDVDGKLMIVLLQGPFANLDTATRNKTHSRRCPELECYSNIDLPEQSTRRFAVPATKSFWIDSSNISFPIYRQPRNPDTTLSKVIRSSRPSILQDFPLLFPAEENEL